MFRRFDKTIHSLQDAFGNCGQDVNASIVVFIMYVVMSLLMVVVGSRRVGLERFYPCWFAVDGMAAASLFRHDL